MISIDALTFDYPGTRALDRITASIEAGTITALVGPNGAGKSTLMRCIAGLDTPLAGQLRVDGIDVAVRARLGFLPDLFGLYDRLPVRKCLEWAGASRGLSWADARARVPTLAGTLGLAELLERPAGTLSRGQRQRVAIGQAIVHQPKLLVLDEPASGLDPEARIGLAALLRGLRDQGMTLLVSSHILAELAEYATHLMILDGGKLLSCGPLAQPARRIMLGLAGPHDVAPLLADESGVAELEGTANEWRFRFDGDEAAQAALLRRLVTGGVPVSRFAPEAASLQDQYLERLRDSRGAA
jgi:ABC-2 type transport system ATP-binding protein